MILVEKWVMWILILMCLWRKQCQKSFRGRISKSDNEMVNINNDKDLSDGLSKEIFWKKVWMWVKSANMTSTTIKTSITSKKRRPTMHCWKGNMIPVIGWQRVQQIGYRTKIELFLKWMEFICMIVCWQKTFFMTTMISLQQNKFSSNFPNLNTRMENRFCTKIVSEWRWRKTQFKSVAVLDGITGEDGKLSTSWIYLTLLGILQNCVKLLWYLTDLWSAIGTIYLCCKTNSGDIWLIFSKEPSQMRWITTILTILCHRKRHMVSWFVDTKLMTKILISFPASFLSIWIKTFMMHPLE